MAYKQIDPADIVNDAEFNLKELIEQEFDAHYVFEMEESYNAVDSEPYKPVFYFQFGDTKPIKRNVIINEEGARGDKISIQYIVFVLLNDDYNPDIKTKRDLNRVSNDFVDTVDIKKEKLLEYFDSFNLSTQVDGSVKSPEGFTVNKHMLSLVVNKER
jgi:hypothetical protein